MANTFYVIPNGTPIKLTRERALKLAFQEKEVATHMGPMDQFWDLIKVLCFRATPKREQLEVLWRILRSTESQNDMPSLFGASDTQPQNNKSTNDNKLYAFLKLIEMADYSAKHHFKVTESKDGFDFIIMGKTITTLANRENDFTASYIRNNLIDKEIITIAPDSYMQRFKFNDWKIENKEKFKNLLKEFEKLLKENNFNSISEFFKNLANNPKVDKLDIFLYLSELASPETKEKFSISIIDKDQNPIQISYKIDNMEISSDELNRNVLIDDKKFSFIKPLADSNGYRKENIFEIKYVKCKNEIDNEIGKIRIDIDRQIEFLQNNLKSKTKDYYVKLFNIENNGKSDIRVGESTLVLGDGDGSTARAILIGIQSGMISLPNDMLKKLARALEIEEAKKDELKSLQSDEELRQIYSYLSKDNSISYRKSIYELIFIGDVCHDRESNNKDADRVIREKMHEYGAVFILGNHDSIIEAYKFTSNILSAIGRAQDSHLQNNNIIQHIDNWSKHEDEVFQAAYGNRSKKLLITHNGTKFLGEVTASECVYESVFGIVKGTNAREVADKINEFYKKDKDKILGTGVLTSFRPEDKDMAGSPLIIVHGHNGVYDGDKYDNVINVNSRKKDERGVNLHGISSPYACFI